MRANNNNHIFYYVYQPKGIAIKDPIKSPLQRFPSEFRPQDNTERWQFHWNFNYD